MLGVLIFTIVLFWLLCLIASKFFKSKEVVRQEVEAELGEKVRREAQLRLNEELRKLQREADREKREMEREIAVLKVRANRPRFSSPTESYVKPLGDGPAYYDVIVDGEHKRVERGTEEYNELWKQIKGV